MADPSVVWSVRGVLMKLSSHHKNKRTQHLDTITSQIASLELLHKANLQPSQAAQLLSLRQEIKTRILHSFDLLQCKLKATAYSTSNKAGKRLAQSIKGRRSKTKIYQLYNPHTKDLLTNPQDIANAFSDYNSDLYNLKMYPMSPQPFSDDINQFLQCFNLPSMTETQLSSLNVPFTEQEILMSINSLPTGKEPGPDGLTGE